MSLTRVLVELVEKDLGDTPQWSLWEDALVFRSTQLSSSLVVAWLEDGPEVNLF